MRSFRPPLHLIYKDLKGAPPSSPNPSHPDTNMEHALQALTLLAYSESAIWKSAEESWKLIWPWCSFFADTFILNQRQLPRTVEGVNFRDDALCTVYPLLANLIKLPGNVAFRAVIRPFSRISHMLTKSWLYAAENHHISLPYISMAWVKHQSLSMNEMLGEWDSAEFEEIAYASPHYLAVTALRTVIYETLQPKIDIMSMNGAFSIIAESQMHNELRQALLAHELPRWIAYAMRHIISQSATEYLNLTSSLSVHSDHMESIRNIAFLLSEIIDSVTWIIQALDEQLILTIFKSKRSWGFCALHKPTAMSLEQVYAKLLRALVPFLYNRSVFRAVVHSIRRVEHLGLDADMPKVFSKTTSEVWDAWHALRVSVANMRKTRSDYKSNGFTACSNVRQVSINDLVSKYILEL
ncbi:hypothetical protein VKT23_006413 [Stygiomarasmius scandens]|uniref:Uncharacterized protein n=1 Tax=Marasmiellus scandens TaxID=2682957 RepID=A0ABR1JTE0_9AGAR